VEITYDGDKECFVMHTRSGDIEFYMRGYLYLADFREYITDDAISCMTTSEREALFNKAIVKRAQEAGIFRKDGD